jgi:quercetin dioxygenase-like cupin family protein
MRRYAFGVCAALAVAWVGAAAVQADDPIVPVYHEPHHRQVFQYGPTRILDLQIPPGDKSWFHSHESPVLYVTLGTSRTRTQNLGEEWGGGGAARGGARRGGAAPAPDATAGDAATPPRPAAPPVAAGALISRVSSTTSYAERAITHRLENVGESLFRAMVVINETAGDEATTQEAAGFSGKPELTNRWFRAYRLALAPGESTPKHRHTVPVAIFQASSGRGGLGIGNMKFEFNDPGQWAFFDAGDAHELKNAGDARMEFVEVEVRRAK